VALPLKYWQSRRAKFCATIIATIRPAIKYAIAATTVPDALKHIDFKTGTGQPLAPESRIGENVPKLLFCREGAHVLRSISSCRIVERS